MRPTSTVAGLSMADLFRIEVETEGRVLSDALLALEREPLSAQLTEELMRAAHSIKGAARIVSMDEAVHVAHALEDLFVQVQNGQRQIAAADVDTLLRAVDLLARLANGTADAGESKQLLEELSGTPPVAATESGNHAIATESGEMAVGLEKTEAGNTPLPLLPIFRSELEIHCTIIRDELQSPQPRAETLRAAFEAIAGSARLLRISPLAAFASAAASRGAKAGVALLAKGVDVLFQLASCDDDQFDGQLARAMAALPSLDGPPPPPPPPAPVAAPAPVVPRVKKTIEERSRPQAKGREVRITADKLDRLMAATGETTVAARWFEGFTRALSRFKQQQDALVDAVEALKERAPQLDLNDLQQQATDCRAEGIARFEEAVTFSRQLENLSGRMYREVIATRMRAFSAGTHPFPRLVRDVARQLGKQAELHITGGSTEVDRDVLEKLEAPLTHLLRNAIDHGLESPEERIAAGKRAEGRIRIEASHQHGMLHVVVADDGRGIDLERVRDKVRERGLAGPEIVTRLTEVELLEFLFLPGFSTAARVSEISGRGVGLDAVQSSVQAFGGVVRVATAPGEGTTFTLKMPITRSVVRALLVEIAGEPYAVPLTRIEHALIATRDQIHVSETREYVRFDGMNVGIIPARQILGIPPRPATDEVPVLIVSNARNRYGIVVDRFAGESDLVLRPLDARLGKVPNISAVSVTLDGTPILLLDVDDIVTTVDQLLQGRQLQRTARQAQEPQLAVRRKRILVVDDSLTVREVERRLLENNGYEVEVAVDGMHGWNAVRSSQFDLVISDVDMPRMSGIELVAHIKGDERLARIPVMIVSYKDREEDRMRGLDAGANYYLTKGSFQDDTMLRAVADLIGPGNP